MIRTAIKQTKQKGRDGKGKLIKRKHETSNGASKIGKSMGLDEGK